MVRRIIGSLLLHSLAIGLYLYVLIQVMQTFTVDNASILLTCTATGLLFYKNNILNLLFGKSGRGKKAQINKKESIDDMPMENINIDKKDKTLEEKNNGYVS